MSKLAIIDLDGVIANTTERFNKAEEAKQQYLEEARNNPVMVEGFSRQKEATNIFWQTAFNPELVALDTLIPGAIEALIALSVADYTIIFLTSRPESMRQATMDWLLAQNAKVEEGFFTRYEKLIMKTSAFQFVKTIVWKAGMVQTLATFHNATHVLFVDDEQANRDEVIKHSGTHKHIIVASSLTDALGKLIMSFPNP